MLQLNLPRLGECASTDYLNTQGVAVVFGRVQDYTQAFTESQLKPVARAVDKRRKEFSTGRQFAMQAQRTLGVPPAFVEHAEDRSPRWPADLMGSISHTDTLALVVLMRKAQYAGMGVDMEEANKVTEPIAQMVLTAREQEALRELQHVRNPEAIIFSGKEAIYKAVNPLVGLMIDFTEVELDFDLQQPGSFRARYVGPNQENRLLESGQGWFEYYEDHVVTSFVIPSFERSNLIAGNAFTA